MREIIFRGKRTDNGEWVEGYYSAELYSNKHYISAWYYGSFAELQKFEVDPETVGQFTGLTDTNGARIFEGDVVMLIFESSKNKGEVVFHNGGFCVHTLNIFVSLQNCPAYEFELIGNIHDNPELLNEEREAKKRPELRTE